MPTELGFPGPSTTVALSDAVAFVNEKSADIASMVGTPALQGVEATLGLLQASNIIGPASATDLTAYITDVSSTPIVHVSSISGAAFTLATGTVGDVTTFGGQVFTAAPKVDAAQPTSAADATSQAQSSDAASSQAPSATPPSAAEDNASLKTNNNGAGSIVVPRSMWVSAAAVLGSVVAGAVAVL
ncbi:hypothetical protein C8Q74DRAFT_491648 [Fomes fomentarius]|nr:hypothetical protein C8Q74DRAFT_491648 [Fomes fomentarius]